MTQPSAPPDARSEWSLLEPGRFEPVRVFGREAPLELEIGFGKGRFLIGSAERRPESDFLGVERARKYFRIALERARKRRLTNLRLVAGDARLLVEERLSDGVLDRVHVYFPDPWPKRRQHKRRLLDPPFVHALAQRMKPGGELLLATDHADYFREIFLSVATEPRFEPADPPAPDPEGRTNYEVKYRREGRPIYRACWVLSPPAGGAAGGAASVPTSRQNLTK